MEVSIAMCTYNGENYLQEQLESLLNQSRPPDEIVIFDDSSTDQTIEILQSYESEHPNIINLHINDENIGVIKNFEKAIKNCSGDIIMLCDQDDIWLPHKIEHQFEIYKETESHLIFHNAAVVDESLKPLGDVWSWYSPSYKFRTIRDTENAVQELAHRNVIQGASMMFDADLKNLVLPLEKDVMHDYQIALVASITGSIYDINKGLLLYRQHNRQKTNIESYSLLAKIRASLARNDDEFREAAAVRKNLLKYIDSIDESRLIIPKNKIKKYFEDSIEYYEGRLNIYDTETSIPNKLKTIGRLFYKNRYSKFGDGVISVGRDMLSIFKF